MTAFVVGIVLMVLTFVGQSIYTAIFGSVVTRAAKDIGLEESEALNASGRWNGRDVILDFGSAGRDGNVRIACVSIAAIGPCRFHACHASQTRTFIGGPPAIDSTLIPADMEVWCDAEAFAQQILSNPDLRERLQIVLRSPWDSVQIDRNKVFVATDVSRFDGDYSALFAAWNAARVFVERLGPGIPEGGTLPAVQISIP